MTEHLQHGVKTLGCSPLLRGEQIMSWVDLIPSCNVRQFFQNLIFDLMRFHQDFCKTKNSHYFNALADIGEEILEQIEADVPPSPELVANLINSMNTQLKEIIRKKEGAHSQQDFNQETTAITRNLTKISDEFQSAIRIARTMTKVSEEKISITVTQGSSMRKSLVIHHSKEELSEKIQQLREVPYHHSSCSSLVSRAFFKHRVAALGGVTSWVVAGGAMLQSGLNVAFQSLSKGLHECQSEFSYSDSRVVVPGVLLMVGGMMFGYALIRSKPTQPKNELESKQELTMSLLPN